MKKIFMLALLVSSDVYSNEVKCLSEIMFSEAQGEPFTGIIAVAEASVNRAGTQKRNACSITGVTRKKVPKQLVDHYKSIAENVAKNKTNNYAKGADSWERGRPSYKGKITAKIGHHVFYKQETNHGKK